MLFVGIPLPGTGAWTGSLIAALLEIDFKKAVLAELLGIIIATVIVSLVSYGLLGSIVGEASLKFAMGIYDVPQPGVSECWDRRIR